MLNTLPEIRKNIFARGEKSRGKNDVKNTPLVVCFLKPAAVCIQQIGCEIFGAMKSFILPDGY